MVIMTREYSCPGVGKPPDLVRKLVLYRLTHAASLQLFGKAIVSGTDASGWRVRLGSEADGTSASGCGGDLIERASQS